MEGYHLNGGWKYDPREKQGKRDHSLTFWLHPRRRPPAFRCSQRFGFHEDFFSPIRP